MAVLIPITCSECCLLSWPYQRSPENRDELMEPLTRPSASYAPTVDSCASPIPLYSRIWFITLCIVFLLHLPLFSSILQVAMMVASRVSHNFPSLAAHTHTLGYSGRIMELTSNPLGQPTQHLSRLQAELHVAKTVGCCFWAYDPFVNHPFRNQTVCLHHSRLLQAKGSHAGLPQ